MLVVGRDSRPYMRAVSGAGGAAVQDNISVCVSRTHTRVNDAPPQAYELFQGSGSLEAVRFIALCSLCGKRPHSCSWTLTSIVTFHLSDPRAARLERRGEPWLAVLLAAVHRPLSRGEGSCTGPSNAARYASPQQISWSPRAALPRPHRLRTHCVLAPGACSCRRRAIWRRRAKRLSRRATRCTAGRLGTTWPRWLQCTRSGGAGSCEADR